jgi:hypothetical protein
MSGDSGGGQVTGSLNAIEIAFVKPFYLKTMGLNAVGVPEDLWNRLIEAGRAVSTEDVTWMLRIGNWRPVVMGAWFSLAVPGQSIEKDVLAAMSDSKGSLTAPPLAVASTLVAGVRAVPAMINYVTFMASDQSRPDGSESFVAAAVEHLGSHPPMTVTDHARQAFRGLFAVAIRLRETWQDGGPTKARAYTEI